MAIIDRDDLLSDLSFYLPAANTLNDAGMVKLSELVITAVGDDEDNYDEVLCKSLKLCATKNKIDSSVNGGKLKKFKYGKTEEEYFKNSTDVWQTYLDMIPETCSMFGYTIPLVVDSDGDYNGIGKLYINPGDELDPLEDCAYPYNTDDTLTVDDIIF